MTDIDEKLDRVLQILDKQLLETYIPTKWKSVIDYCENEELKPERVLELLIMSAAISKKLNKG